MDIQEQVLLAPLTTFGIGGPAQFFARAKSVSDIEEAIAFAKERNIPVCILGGGSNTLFDDAGFSGLVIQVEIEGVQLERDMQGALLVAGAGEKWDALVERAVGEDLWGIENLSGIPGTVGGAAVQNIGAYGVALSQTLAWIDVYDVSVHAQTRLTSADYMSGYRDSVFKHEPDRYVVLQVALRLLSVPHPIVSYKDLAERFAGAQPTLKEVREAVLAIRAAKFPDLSVEGTAGSFFKNPVLPEAQAKELAARYPGMPSFALPESSDIKIPLGWFLDYRHGIMDLRDLQVGGARMYEKQFLVLVVRRHTSSRDVKELARIVQEKVFKTLNIAIEPEVRVL
jgi:UDP-N-acetylmuramate dehydrogenase